MRKPVSLYCDSVHNDGSNGHTFDASKIYYNFERIDKEWFDRFTSSLAVNDTTSIILQAGRFIAIISMTLDRTQQGMVFLDLHNDEDYAKKIASEKDGHEKNSFMEVFYLISRTYEQEFAKFSLVEGSLPTDTK